MDKLKTYADYRTVKQIVRYGIVGLLNNGFGYLIYLLVTYFWLEPKLAVTVLYPIGVLMAYWGHAKYSFKSDQIDRNSFIRYVVTYIIGYIINFLALYIFSDIYGFPHQLIQVISIFVVAGNVFLLLKFFVFPKNLNIYNKG
ncbi:GtrA family protein [Legionella sp. km772]|uniref:GtrA family protein n=1 Tax=Legionella sp. km772 TaxID=2498111 RepID=UPI000F8E8000|nr:GtrA family protein [Legionella sp. km772]RUR08746.1 GtrA family protein [Legionella sp. km772]